AIDIIFLKGVTNESRTIKGKNIIKAGIDNTLPSELSGIYPIGDNDYLAHPAFTFGEDELKGIWAAKFPAGYAGGNNGREPVSTGLTYSGTVVSPNFYGTVTSGVTEMNYPVFLPKTYAYNNINAGDSFNLAQNLDKSRNIYGLT